MCVRMHVYTQVWPNAIHKRFEHSLGVYHLAGMPYHGTPPGTFGLWALATELGPASLDYDFDSLAYLCLLLSPNPFESLFMVPS